MHLPSETAHAQQSAEIVNGMQQRVGAVNETAVITSTLSNAPPQETAHSQQIPEAVNGMMLLYFNISSTSHIESPQQNTSSLESQTQQLVHVPEASIDSALVMPTSDQSLKKNEIIMATEPLLAVTPPDQSSAAPHKSAGPHNFSEFKNIILDRFKRQDLAMEDKWALNSANSEVARLTEELAKVQSELLQSHFKLKRDTDSAFIRFASGVESRLAEVEKTYKGFDSHVDFDPESNDFGSYMDIDSDPVVSGDVANSGSYSPNRNRHTGSPSPSIEEGYTYNAGDNMTAELYDSDWRDQEISELVDTASTVNPTQSFETSVEI
ncbi:hypothetical protein BDR26DRAFT_934305 [Obelidium mucronatum]|nr:hypothetical protein BDR26DRAFT_934305 [Obelidium mucronatum]